MMDEEEDDALLVVSDVEESVGDSQVADPEPALLIMPEPVLGIRRAPHMDIDMDSLSLDDSLLGIDSGFEALPTSSRERDLEQSIVKTSSPTKTSATSPSSSTTSTSSSSSPPRSRLLLVLWIVAGMIVLAMVPLAVVFALQDRHGSSEDTVPTASRLDPPHNTSVHTTPSPTPLGNPRPTPVPPVQLAVAAAVDASRLADATTPEAAALKWMLETDGMAYWADAVSVQRFAVTALNLALGRGVADPTLPECQWTGVVCDNTTSVVGIQWNNASLTGTLPPSIGLLSQLIELDLAENALGGSLPKELFDLRQLQRLYLHQNQLRGTLSDDFAKLSQLRHFYGGDNQFVGRFPKGLGSPSRGADNVRPLRYLSLYKNQLSGPLPSMMNLRELFYLDLGYNNLNGTFPADWVEGFNVMRQITNIYLDHNQFTGAIPASIGDLGNGRVEQLVLNDNQFTGTFAGFYVDPRFLQTLHLQHNQLTAVVDRICDQTVWIGGELVSYRADCEVCTCASSCDACY